MLASGLFYAYENAAKPTHGRNIGTDLYMNGLSADKENTDYYVKVVNLIYANEQLRGRVGSGLAG